MIGAPADALACRIEDVRASAAGTRSDISDLLPDVLLPLSAVHALGNGTSKGPLAPARRDVLLCRVAFRVRSVRTNVGCAAATTDLPWRSSTHRGERAKVT
jgi:hypothetical protein